MRRYFGIDHVSEKQRKIYEIIFESDTPEGKRFDVILLWTIVASIVVVLLESIEVLRLGHEWVFRILEYIFTAIFLAEYIIRIYSVGKKLRYVLSFFGIIDLLAILPAFISIIFPDIASLIVVRALRLLRVFRVLKMVRFMDEANILLESLKMSRVKIFVFLFSVLSLVIIFGTLMYVIEGKSPEAGFTSIPQSIYWAIVTLTTVGYGDIAPLTPLGRALAAVVMILGYAIIAVPTGIVTAQMTSELEAKRHRDEAKKLFSCPKCKIEGHAVNSKYCYNCGETF